MQGDVIALYRSDYNSTSKTNTPTLVATYTYDPWGAPTGIYDANGSTISQTAYHVAADNPVRYRGNRYDGDTRLYYLQSRYYDPVVRRFINADVYASTGQGFIGYNAFAYCLNNPTRNIDTTGEAAMALYASSYGIAYLAGTSVVPVIGLAIGLAILAYTGYKAWNRYKQAQIASKRPNSSSNIDCGGKNERHHVIEGTNGRHKPGWMKMGIDPNGSNPWAAILPVLKDVLDNADTIWEKITKEGNVVYYYSKYYVEEGVEIVLKIFYSVSDGTYKISDAIPYIK